MLTISLRRVMKLFQNNRNSILLQWQLLFRSRKPSNCTVVHIPQLRFTKVQLEKDCKQLVQHCLWKCSQEKENQKKKKCTKVLEQCPLDRRAQNAEIHIWWKIKNSIAAQMQSCMVEEEWWFEIALKPQHLSTMKSYSWIWTPLNSVLGLRRDAICSPAKAWMKWGHAAGEWSKI